MIPEKHQVQTFTEEQIKELHESIRLAEQGASKGANITEEHAPTMAKLNSIFGATMATSASQIANPKITELQAEIAIAITNLETTRKARTDAQAAVKKSHGGNSNTHKANLVTAKTANIDFRNAQKKLENLEKELEELQAPKTITIVKETPKKTFGLAWIKKMNK